MQVSIGLRGKIYNLDDTGLFLWSNLNLVVEVEDAQDGHPNFFELGPAVPAKFLDPATPS